MKILLMFVRIKTPTAANEEACAREAKLRNYFTDRLNSLAESKSLVASQVNSLTIEVLKIEIIYNKCSYF